MEQIQHMHAKEWGDQFSRVFRREISDLLLPGLTDFSLPTYSAPGVAQRGGTCRNSHELWWRLLAETTGRGGAL